MFIKKPHGTLAIDFPRFGALLHNVCRRYGIQNNKQPDFTRLNKAMENCLSSDRLAVPFGLNVPTPSNPIPQYLDISNETPLIGCESYTLLNNMNDLYSITFVFRIILFACHRS
jgi:hypothetical protein